MDWRDIPSLAALRAFEAAARTGSLSAAARELNVTHAAIAQHVRTLESHFAQGLLHRDGQRMVTTEAGGVLARVLTEGFGQIGTGVQTLLAQTRETPLRVATTPTLAAHWLMPRMSRFWRAHPTIEVEILPGRGSVDLRRGEADLAIRFGRGDWPGLTSEPLLSAGLTGIAAPDYWPEGPPDDPKALAGATFLTDGYWVEDGYWLRTLGLDPDTLDLRIYANTDLAREAARAGLGIAIVPRALLADSLADGSLVSLLVQDDATLHYHIVTRPEADRPARRSFMAWLREEAAA